jgi:hypothetical protein
MSLAGSASSRYPKTPNISNDSLLGLGSKAHCLQELNSSTVQTPAKSVNPSSGTDCKSNPLNSRNSKEKSAECFTWRWSRCAWLLLDFSLFYRVYLASDAKVVDFWVDAVQNAQHLSTCNVLGLLLPLPATETNMHRNVGRRSR